jgi:hypothetical protein
MNAATDPAAAVAPQQLSALLAKLDQALGDDGQLL